MHAHPRTYSPDSSPADISLAAIETATLAERFWTKVIVHGDDECWEWTACQNRGGYGRIGRGYTDEGTEQAHRVSWLIHNGRIPDGMHVLHTCDNAECTNPRHLYLGGNIENGRDRADRGRAVVPLGSRHPSSKLSADDVREIRRLHGSVSHKELARRYGVRYQSIQAIIKRKNWAWLT